MIGAGSIPKDSSPRRAWVLPAAAAGFWILIAVFLLFVWPTPYRSLDTEGKVRENRLTGTIKERNPSGKGWRDAPARRSNTKATAARGGSPAGGSPVGGPERPRRRDGGEGGWWYQEGKPARQGDGEEGWWYREKEGRPGGGNGDAGKQGEKPAETPSDGWWHD